MKEDSMLEAARSVSHQRIVAAYDARAGDEALRRAYIDAQFRLSPVHEETAAFLERDPDGAARVLTPSHRITMQTYLEAKRRAAAARELISGHEAVR